MQIYKRNIEREIAEKVWFYAFIEPNEYNIYQINKLIFGGTGNRAYRAIEKEKFVEKGYLKKTPAKRTGRSEKLLVGTVDPLILKIKERTSLDPSDEDVLRDKLESPAFKYLIKNSTAKEPIASFLDIFDYILFLFEFILMAMDEKGTLTRKSRDIITKKQYDDQKIKRRKKIKIELAKELERLDVSSREKYNEELEILQDLPNFLIFPRDLLIEIKKSSLFGKIYNDFKDIFHKATDLFDSDFENFLNKF